MLIALFCQIFIYCWFGNEIIVKVGRTKKNNNNNEKRDVPTFYPCCISNKLFKDKNVLGCMPAQGVREKRVEKNIKHTLKIYFPFL